MKIHQYARAGNIAGVAAELAKGVSIESAEEGHEAYTPLMCAVASKKAGIDMVRFLIERGADVNAVTDPPPYPARPVELEDITPEVEAMVREMLGDKAEKILQQMQDGTQEEKPLKPSATSVAGVAIKSRNLNKLREVTGAGAKLSYVDENGYDALIDASYGGGMGGDEEGLIEILQFLIDHGAKALQLAGSDIRVTEYGSTALHCACEYNRPEMVAWLLQFDFDIEAKDEHFEQTPLEKGVLAGAAECVSLLIRDGADALSPGSYDEPLIKKAENLEVVRVLLAAGAELSDLSHEMRAELTGMEHDGALQATKDEFIAGRDLRVGRTNPELMDIAFWKAMVRCGCNAYRARQAFDAPIDEKRGKRNRDNRIWCFQRFGKSLTVLPDGQIIEIGGEHEDHYDPDFCIYNDVVVHHGGGEFDILGYPEEAFPPTDFHSATLVGNFIYIIGCLGYPEDRKPGETPVYRLDCDTYSIEKVDTTGDKPGWISSHKAKLVDGGIAISGGKVVTRRDGYEDNRGSYILSLDDLRWRREG